MSPLFSMCLECKLYGPLSSEKQRKLYPKALTYNFNFQSLTSQILTKASPKKVKFLMI